MPPRRQVPSRRSPPKDDSAVAIADRIHSAAIRLLRRLRVEDEASGLTAPRLSALSVIVFRGPLTLGELAAAEQVRPPTITRLARELEREGLIQRVGDLNDLRIQRVTATPAGKRLLRAGRARRVSALANAVRALPPRDRSVLDRAIPILEQLVRL